VGVAVYTCNPNLTQEAEARDFQVPGLLGLRSKFEASPGYIARPYLKKENRKKARH
jgi:hypothetical protein